MLIASRLCAVFGSACAFAVGMYGLIAYTNNQAASLFSIPAAFGLVCAAMMYRHKPYCYWPLFGSIIAWLPIAFGKPVLFPNLPEWVWNVGHLGLALLLIGWILQSFSRLPQNDAQKA